MNRVVITGMGTVSASGLSPDSLWESMKAKQLGFHKISGFDTTNFEVTYAAEMQNWNPENHGITKKEARRLDLFCQYGLAAANQAIADAGDFAKNLDPFRIGVLAGSGTGGFSTFEEEHSKYLAKGPNRVSVFFIPMMIVNMVGGTIAIAHGFKGDNYAPVSACSTGNHAIGEAFRKIKHGYLDACVCGGAESAITELALGAFNNMGALSRATDPTRLSIPFDAERGGFVMGEGAGMLVLETLDHAVARGAKIYGEIVGYGATDDAFHITSPDPTGVGPAKAMTLAVEEAGLTPADIGYINAHGTSTELNDKYETNAIKIAFGDHAKKLAISSTKSMTGHLLGAAGAIEAIICAKALEDGILPPTAGYKIPDPLCDLDYITEGPRKTTATVGISNSFGFGGHNATLAIAKWEGK